VGGHVLERRNLAAQAGTRWRRIQEKNGSARMVRKRARRSGRKKTVAARRPATTTTKPAAPTRNRRTGEVSGDMAGEGTLAARGGSRPVVPPGRVPLGEDPVQEDQQRRDRREESEGDGEPAHPAAARARKGG